MSERQSIDEPRHEEIGAGVRRIVGVAALRQLRHLVDAERAQDVENARAAGKFGYFLAALLLLVIVWWIVHFF